MFASGNQDMEALYDNNISPGGASHGYAGLAARLDLPANGPSRCPSVDSMIYSNVAVVSLDANDLSQEIPTNAGYSGGQQLSWLTRHPDQGPDGSRHRLRQRLFPPLRVRHQQQTRPRR